MSSRLWTPTFSVSDRAFLRSSMYWMIPSRILPSPCQTKIWSTLWWSLSSISRWSSGVLNASSTTGTSGCASLTLRPKVKGSMSPIRMMLTTRS